MMNEGDPLKFIRVRLNVLTPETPQQEVRDALENLIPLLARLEEVKNLRAFGPNSLST